MASKYICNNPDESDDCGGWCLTHKCENCKWATVEIVEDRIKCPCCGHDAIHQHEPGVGMGILYCQNCGTVSTMLDPESFISGEKCALENTCWSIRMLYELKIIDFSVFDRIVQELKRQAKEIDWMGENIIDKSIGALDRVEKCVKEVYDKCL